MKSILSRRAAMKSIAATSTVPLFGSMAAAQSDQQQLPPVRTITRGPKHHWFGYYDKLEFDPTNRYVLSNEVDFEGRTPLADDVIRVGMVDTRDDDQWIELGSSPAWGWQQGCMLQWRPQSSAEVLWNDREGDKHVCRVMNVKTRNTRTLPRPIYAPARTASGRLRLTLLAFSVCDPATATLGLAVNSPTSVLPKTLASGK